jgi:hypothetical protein
VYTLCRAIRRTLQIQEANNGQNHLMQIVGQTLAIKLSPCLKWWIIISVKNVFIWIYGVKASGDELRPVMFWIHGWALYMGSSSEVIFNVDILSSIGDVVVVTFNYLLCDLWTRINLNVIFINFQIKKRKSI